MGGDKWEEELPAEFPLDTTSPGTTQQPGETPQQITEQKES